MLPAPEILASTADILPVHWTTCSSAVADVPVYPDTAVAVSSGMQVPALHALSGYAAIPLAA